MPEVNGTVKAISKSGKGIILAEYDDQWFNQGKGFEGAWPAVKGESVTFTYEQTYDAEGKAKFWVVEAWPTSSGKPAPTRGPAPTDGPVPTKTTGPATTQPEATGPVPTPPEREKAILFQVCLKAAQEWVLNVEALPKIPAEVMTIADLYYRAGLKIILGDPEEPEEPTEGDPGPEEPA